MGFLRFVATGLGAACALAAVLAQGGRWSGWLDLLTHFAPLYLAGGVLALTVALFTPQRPLGTRLAILGGIATVAALALVSPEMLRPASPSAPAGSPGQIKLIQFNTEHAPGVIEDTVRWLAEQDPDVLVLQDSSPQLREAIAKRLPRHMYCAPNCEVALFSRAVPLEAEGLGTGNYGLAPPLVIARYGPDQGGYTVVGLHYTRPMDIGPNSPRTRVRIRDENAKRMLKAVEPLPKGRLIVAGDFNATPWSFALRRGDADLGLERRTRSLFTWPAIIPLLPIDHIYAGPEWRTVRIERGPSLGSDHHAVVAVLAPRQGP